MSLQTRTWTMRLSELADCLGGRLHGEDIAFDAVSTDTRSLQPGDLFVALQGPRFDAHDFLAEARAGGACAALVQRPMPVGLPQLLVEDTRLALGRLAAAWRARFTGPVVAVTGSNGKTTVKEMVSTILALRGPGLVTRGNYNNDIGMPLTLLRLQPGHRYAVIEMGASKPGDIHYLTHIARPSVAVITNAAPAHLEGLGDIAGVARTKGEIFGGLGSGGTAVINKDDPRNGVWRVMTEGRPRLSFGIRNKADFRATQLEVNSDCGCSFLLHTPVGSLPVRLRLAGRHNVMNALAAAAAAFAVGASPEEIRVGLEKMRPVKGRLEFKPGRGALRVIDDTYNANPGSVRAALEVLVAAGGEGQKVLVLGDMGELGNASQALHEQVGRQARMVGVDRIYAVGECARITAGAFGKGAHHYPDQASLIEALLQDYDGMVGVAVTMLVKGSRSMAMERVVEALVPQADVAARGEGALSGDGRDPHPGGEG